METDEVLYHCSPIGGLTVLEPGVTKYFGKPRQVCLTASLPMALLYGAGWAAKAIGISQLATTCAVFLALVGCASVVVAQITAILRF